jgi:hypothetical protein
LIFRSEGTKASEGQKVTRIGEDLAISTLAYIALKSKKKVDTPVAGTFGQE